MKKIVVVHIISGLSTGGAEMMLYKLLLHNKDLNFSSVVISLTDKGNVGKKIEALGVPVYNLGLKQNLFDIIKFFKLQLLVNKYEPDIIQGWMYHGNLFAQLCSWFNMRAKCLWNIRGSHYVLKKVKKSTAFVIWLGAKLSFAPKKIINNSKHSAEKHEEILGYKNNKTIVIPNGFDTELFKPSGYYRHKFREEMNFTDKDILIGLIGRYNTVKGYDLFIEAANRLVNKKIFNKCIKFILIGNKVEYSNELLAKPIKNYGLEQYFYLLGERENLQTIIPSLDIVVSSSYSEGFPNVIGEAMSCGVPCVVTDVGDSKWIVGDTGIVVPSNNVEALVEGIEYMLNLPKTEREKMGMAARKRIIDNFSINLIVKKYEELYKKIINQ